MRKHEIKIGGIYAVKVSGRISPVRIISTFYSGWNGKNIRTGRMVRIKTAGRLHFEISQIYDEINHKWIWKKRRAV